MKILLTGASGFIGTYYRHNSVFKDFIHNFSFHQETIANTNFSDYTTIIHLAALVHQMNDTTLENYYEINVFKTLELAKKAKNDGVKQFILMSTVKVYGEESDTIYTEFTPCDPKDPYGQSKLLAEHELQKLEDEHFKICIIRTPIVYGKGVKGNIKSLIQFIQKFPVLPFENIHNQRSMVFVGNLSHLIDTVVKQNSFGVFLASDDLPLSTTELVKKIVQTLALKRYLISIPLLNRLLQDFKPKLFKRLYGNMIVNNDWTKQNLNFHNPYSTDEGIKQMLQGNE